MKLHFEANLEYQTHAVEAVCDLFRGQEICRTEFTVTRDALGPQYALAFHESDLGIGNRLSLLDDQLLDNLKAIQLRNGLAPQTALPPATLPWRWKPARARRTCTSRPSSS